MWKVTPLVVCNHSAIVKSIDGTFWDALEKISGVFGDRVGIPSRISVKQLTTYPRINTHIVM